MVSPMNQYSSFCLIPEQCICMCLYSTPVRFRGHTLNKGWSSLSISNYQVSLLPIILTLQVHFVRCQIGQSTSFIDNDATYTYTCTCTTSLFLSLSLSPISLSLSPPSQIHPGTPPDDSFVRAMAIHKAPEMISENLTCCPKHVDEQKRAGEKYIANLMS